MNAANVSFVPLCAVSLSLLEGGANGIDDTATQFAEVRADGGILGGTGWGGGQRGWVAITPCLLIHSPFFSSFYLSFHSCLLSRSLFSSTGLLFPPLSYRDNPVAMALIVTGAAIYNRQRHPRLRTPAPWRTPGKSQRPWGVGRRTNWGVSPSRLRGAYGWSTRSWGSLGTGAPPSPAQPEEIPVQRQQQTRPLACCWRVSSCVLSRSPSSWLSSLTCILPLMTVAMLFMLLQSWLLLFFWQWR